MRYPVPLDAPGSPTVEVEPDIFRGPRVYLDGERLAARRERGRPVFAVPLADGSERILTLAGGFLGLRATIGGRTVQIEPRLTLIETFLVVLPIAVVGAGWALGSMAGAAFGGLIGGIGVGIARQMIRFPWPLAVRALGAVAITAVGYVIVGLVPGA